ncbi:hypothetical protein [Natronorubrum sulfidifaciens]|uniref:Uncharacterized protein n=1 Tax=Natronorubrum sulfidifaciens JCM 14089 TaxID=1230460 RepID=L9W873_9EURY|nr:hypothetical protein [Natronorubrum sulfidifaciens]ELY44503.1 hypothetical protein C495_11389 [Natronorubrum sulfidifaciens JCM 14089]
MTEESRARYRKHGESPQPRRLGGLAVRFGRSRCSLPAVLTSAAFADEAGPFQSLPRGGLDGSIRRGTDEFGTMEVRQ